MVTKGIVIIIAHYIWNIEKNHLNHWFRTQGVTGCFSGEFTMIIFSCNNFKLIPTLVHLILWPIEFNAVYS